MELDLLLDHRRDILKVLDIFLGNDDLENLVAMGRQGLFLEAADGQNLAAQGNLPGHGNILAQRPVGQGRGHGRSHSDAGGRAVLGNGAGRDVDMHIIFLIERG